jgi:hypothetical protein
MHVRGYFRIKVYERPVPLTPRTLGLQAQREWLPLLQSGEQYTGRPTGH